jgi:hypothetical protein
VTALFAVAAGLLVLAGVLKLRASQPAGLVEVALGVAALAYPRPLVAALVAVAYLAFAASSLRLAVAGAEDCGCFGDVDAPAGYGHVVINLCCAAVAVVAVVAPQESLASLVVGSPLVGIVVVLGVAASVYGLFLAYTALPTAWSSFDAGSVRET